MFKVESEKLVEVLKVLKGSMAKRVAHPILGYLHYQVDGEKVSVSATDLDVWVTLNLACEPDFDEEGLINIRELEDFLKGVKGSVTFVPVYGVAVDIKAGNKQTRLAMLKVDDYPVFPIAQGDSVEADSDFLEGLALCLPFTASPEIRPNYSCVFCLGDRMYATDTYHLAKTGCPGVTSNIKAQTTKALLNAAKLYKTDRLMMVANEKENEFSTGDFTIFSYSLDAMAPNFEKIIPKPDSAYCANILTLETAEFMDAIKNFPVKGVTVGSRTVLKIKELSRGVNGSEILIKDADRETEVKIRGESSGEPLRIYLCRDYLLHLIETCKDKQITIHYGGWRDAIYVQGENFLSLLLPVLITNDSEFETAAA